MKIGDPGRTGAVLVSAKTVGERADGRVSSCNRPTPKSSPLTGVACAKSDHGARRQSAAARFGQAIDSMPARKEVQIMDKNYSFDSLTP